MPFRREIRGEAVYGESKDKKYFCAPEFENMLTFTNVKNFLTEIRRLESGLPSQGTGDTNFLLDLVGIKDPQKNTDFLYQLRSEDKVYYLKATSGGKSFFVKHTPTYYHSGGYNEAVSNVEAQEILSRNEVQRVKVVPFKLGYQDKKNSYIVSEWLDTDKAENFEIYLLKLGAGLIMPSPAGMASEQYSDAAFKHSENNPNAPKIEALRARYKQVESLLKDFYDVQVYNVCYDVDTDMMYLIDLNKPK